MRQAARISTLGIAVLAGSAAAAEEPCRFEAHEHAPSPHATIQALRLPEGLPERFDVDLVLDGVPRTLQLARYSLRAPSFGVRTYLPERRTVRLTPPEPATYRGRVTGLPESAVVAALTPGGLRAQAHDRQGRSWRIEHLPGEDRRSGTPRHSVEPSEHHACTGALDEPPLAQAPAPGPTFMRHAGQHLAEIAVDADHRLYLANGSSISGTVAAVEAQLNEVDFVYARDVLVRYAITDILVRTTSFYPNIATLLADFSDEWNENQTAVPRDVAHLLTDTGGLAGVARLGVVCDLGEAYSWSSGPSTVTAHELGHNWNAWHCHDWVPCDAMCGACSRFAPTTSDVIIAYRDTTSCLDELGPYPAALAPFTRPDVAWLTRDEIAAGASRTFDVLANDHDGNLDPLAIDSFDATSDEGGSIALSPGTGGGGADELVWVSGGLFPGSDHFRYDAGDGSFQTRGDVELRVEAPSLAGYWKLDEVTGVNTPDASGGGRLGAVLGDPAVAAGVYGNALKLDGVDDSVSIVGLERDMRSVTISAWLTRTGSQSPFAGIVTAWAADTVAGLNFGTANELRYQWDRDPAAAAWNSGLVVPDSQWVFVALVVDPGQARLYLHNGATLQSAVHVLAHDVQDFGGLIRLGWDESSPTKRLAGRLDDVRIYDYALSPSEIAGLHDRGGKAYAPVPYDGGGRLPGRRTLGWSAGLGALSHDVYFGASYAAVRDATHASPQFRGNVTATTFVAPPPLIEGATYSWRIDEVTAGGVVRGDVWVFSVEAPLARWKLDELSGNVAQDASGGFHGTYHGGAALGGAPAQAELVHSIHLDGIDDFVELPPLDLGRNEVSFSVWVRRDGVQSQAAGMLYSRSASTVAGLSVGPSGNVSYSWNEQGLLGSELQSTPLVVPDGQWALVVLAIAPDKTTVFVGRDGAVTSHVRHRPNEREEFDGSLYLGQDPLGGRLFRGDMDDVRIYGHALNVDDVDALYAAGIGAGRVPDRSLRLAAAGGGVLSLSWSPSCVGSDVDYAVYEGAIGDFAGNLPVTCSTGGATSASITPSAGDRYFLVVPASPNREGGYGTGVAGQPRTTGGGACRPQFEVDCP